MTNFFKVTDNTIINLDEVLHAFHQDYGEPRRLYLYYKNSPKYIACTTDRAHYDNLCDALLRVNRNSGKTTGNSGSNSPSSNYDTDTVLGYMASKEAFLKENDSQPGRVG